MPKVIAALLFAEARQRCAEEWPERLGRATACGPHDRFQFGEAELDRIEVRTVRRQIPDRGARARQDHVDALDLVRAEIVGNYDIARAQRGHEDLLEIGEKAGAINRALEDRGRGEPGHPQGRQKRTRLPTRTRRVIIDTRTGEPAAIAPQQIRGDAGFVEKREPLDIPPRRLLLPDRAREMDVRSIVFGGPYRFF